MVVTIFGTNQILKDKAVWWISTLPDFDQATVEVIHKPVGFLDLIHNGSKALFWSRVKTMLKSAEESSDLTIFDFSLLDYLWYAEKRKISSPEFRKNILQNINSTHLIYLVDNTENHDSLVKFLHSLGVNFRDVTDEVINEITRDSGL